MSARSWIARHRGAAVPLAVAIALGLAGLVFRAKLVAWFTGKDAGGAWSAPARAVGGGLTIEASVQPDPPRQRGNRVRVEVTDAARAPVDGAQVAVTYDMAAMGAMAEMKSTFAATPRGGGRYEVGFDLPMSGSWTLVIEVTAEKASATARYTLTVGQPGLTALGGEGATAPSPAGADADEVSYYTCSMHPAVHMDHPGTCPICAMNLSPVTKGEAQSGVIRIDDARRKVIGVRTGKAVRAPMSYQVRAVGRLTYDETRLRDVTLRVGGFVTELRVAAIGQAVRKGETLFTLYSPELFAAQQEYLLARQSQDAAATIGTTGRSDGLLRAAEKKLRLWGMSAPQIAALAARGEPTENVAFPSPASGYVIEKDVVEGDSIAAGARVFRIAALDKIWVEADVYEADLAAIHKGAPATIALSYQPGTTYSGKVAFVYPYLDPATRAGRVRIELPNQGLALKPDMYATVTFEVALGERLQVPASAVIYTGPRRLVFVDLGDGRLQPREITIGAQTPESIEVRSGLHDGDMVVTSGNFLVAAESRIRSASKFWADTE